MDKGDFGDFTLANLLMASERHLPSRKREEHDSVLAKQGGYFQEKLLFSIGLDMFDAVMHHHHVKQLAFVGFRRII